MSEPSPTITIRYGADQSVDLHLAEESLLAIGGAPCGEPLEDVAAATVAALATPIDYPPLVDATLSGDTVCIAVDRDVPQVPSVVAGVIQPLLEAGVAPQQITIVLAEEYPREHVVTASLPDPVQDAIHVRRHDSRDGNGLAYLATAGEGDSIQINRHICDADVVIPISCIRAETSDGDWGQRGNIFPTFADAATRGRYATPWEALGSAAREKRKRGREEAAWLLGARLTVQIVSGGADRVLHIVAGDVDSVGLRSRDLASVAWGLSVPQRAGLVIAAIEGAHQQTWENVSRAITAALRVVQEEHEERPAIVICTDLQEMPNPAMIRAMMGEEDDGHYMDPDADEIERGASVDSLAGGQLRETLQRMPVYLLSRLPEEVVLDLGLAYVEEPAEINNLCRRRTSCIVLGNAQHVLPTVMDHEAAEVSRK